MADDAVRAPTGTIAGVKFGDDPATALNCTSQDVKIATAQVINYLLANADGSYTGTPIPYNPGDNVTCNKDQGIRLTMSAKLNETASSARSDIGIWIAADGGNAQTGLCNHYNLPTNPLTPGTGVSNPDGDSCGDLNAGAFVPSFQLGTFDAVCETSPTSNNQLHIGSCIGWKEPGADEVCPLPDAKPNQAPNWVTNSADGFRFGTLYANKSKCNCEGFDVPITVINPQPNLGITKTADAATVSAGSQIGFTVTLSNTGVGDATTVGVNDPLPAGTGVSWSIETAVTGWSITGSAPTQTLVYSATTLAAGASTSVHVISSTTGASCKTYSNTATASLGNGTAPSPVTATTTVNCPDLSVVKTPDKTGDTGYLITVPGTATFTITVSNSSATGTGTATGVVLTDTLPGDATKYTWTADNTTECVNPIGTVVVNTVTRSRLVCNIGTLAPGASFTVHVSTPVSSSNLLVPPSPAGTPIEIDGDLADGGAAGKDWADLGTGLLNCLANPRIGCDIDKLTGKTDNSFGQGTKEDDAVPTIVSGSIPNNKSDLLRFYVATERFVTNNFLYLAWERVQAPNGTTNMDFELNQSAQLSANGVTPVRTAGDILIKYDLEKGGTVPTLGFHRWITTGAASQCEASNTVPCWGKVTSLLNGAQAAVNLANGTDDPILAPQQSGDRLLDALTFGEASIDLQTTGIFQTGVCVNFGQAYLKSRSSDAFTSEIKDFIAPISVQVTNCAPVTLPNTAWATASNVSSAKSDNGEIKLTN